MKKPKLSFKSKVFIPIITIFIISVFVITMNNYMRFDSSVKTKTNTILTKFTENIILQIEHLAIMQNTTIEIINDLLIPFDADVEALFKLQEEMNIENTIKETSIGENGFGIVAHNGILIAHKNSALLRQNIQDEDWYKAVNSGDGYAWITIADVKYYSQYKNTNGYTVVGLIPEAEYYIEISQVLFDTVFFVSAALIIMIVILYIIMGKLLKPVKTVTESLREIARGNFDARVEGNYSDEFALIKNAVNDMAISLTSYLNDKLEAERLVHEAELSKLELLVKVYYDALTNVYNRRYLDENIEPIIKSLSRSNGTLSIIMSDIDCFKQYNDTYGHSEGDECLKIIAKTLKESITREDDFVGRYGGEEFYIVLPNTDENGAKQIAEKVLNSVREHKINNEKSIAKPYITISLGIASGHVKHMQKGESYIKRADEALYMSKQNGRDRYTFLPMV